MPKSMTLDDLKGSLGLDICTPFALIENMYHYSLIIYYPRYPQINKRAYRKQHVTNYLKSVLYVCRLLGYLDKILF